MLPRTAHPVTLAATTSALSAHPAPSGRFLHRDRLVRHEAPRIVLEPDRFREGPSGTSTTSSDAPEVVCADDGSCICPLPEHVTDAERAVMDDLSRQASRLATALAWIFALVVLTAVVLLMLR